MAGVSLIIGCQILTKFVHSSDLDIPENTDAIRIVFFHSRLQPTQIHLFKALMASKRVERITVVHWDQAEKHGNLYEPEQIDGVEYVGRSTLDTLGLIELLKRVAPQVSYVPGWMDKGYIEALRHHRQQYSIKVVAGIDDQWHNTLRQNVGKYYFRWKLRSLIDFFWVAGGPQRVFASQFGYAEKDVIPHLLSGDVQTFGDLPLGTKKRFLFLGRFDKVKGLDSLIAAYRMLPDEVKSQWDLELIGGGPLAEQLSQEKNLPGLKLHGFVQPRDLPTLLEQGGIACFPGMHEQWGTAIHELAAAGFPLILSNACGSKNEFMLQGWNGWSYRPGDEKLLCQILQSAAKITPHEHMKFAQRSRQLGLRISPTLSAASLLSVLD